jgi:hypothetical protein
MNDRELREMVRESIARHLGSETVRATATDTAGGGATHESAHASHQRLPLASGDEDGACVIEPSVRCNHCGYCLSFGH